MAAPRRRVLQTADPFESGTIPRSHRTALQAWPSGLTARACVDADADALWHLFAQPDVRRFAVMDDGPFETPEAIQTWLRGTVGAFRMVGSLDDRLVGFAGLYPMLGRQDHVGWITLSVDERVRGRGIGSGLVALQLAAARTLAGLRRVQLHVLADNEPAIALYRRFEFRIEGCHEAMVRTADGYADVLTMALRL